MSVRPSPKLRPGFWDAVVVLAVVALAVCMAAVIWFGGYDASARTVVIRVDGEVERQFSLEEAANYTVSANGCTLQVAVANGEVWVQDSDCPTQDCVHTGRISRSGQSIVCLPARVIVTIEGAADNGDGPDIVIG